MSETTMERAVRIGGEAAQYGARFEAAMREAAIVRGQMPIPPDAIRAAIEKAYRSGAEAEAARG